MKQMSPLFWHPCCYDSHFLTQPSFWSQPHSCKVLWLDPVQLQCCKILKMASVVVPAASGISRNTFCHDTHTHAHKLKTLPAHCVLQEGHQPEMNKGASSLSLKSHHTLQILHLNETTWKIQRIRQKEAHILKEAKWEYAYMCIYLTLLLTFSKSDHKIEDLFSFKLHYAHVVVELWARAIF